MPPPTQHVAITPLGPSSAATVTWLLRGQLHVTVVVKATFALVPEGRMSLVKPEPIALDEQPDPSGRALRTAGDLAPYLGQCDVVVTGHAELPPGFSSPEVVVRLAVVQGGQVCIDKQALLDGSARVGVARSHVRIDGMGPLGRASPQRSRLLGGGDARRLAGLRLDIPEELDGSYFQAAPVDQRLRTLRGDEWIVLGGMVAQRPKLRTQLPEARGAARLYRGHRAAPRAGEPISLRADTVHVDVDRRCCSVVWRGHAPVDEAELASLRVLAGVETPAQPLAWVDPFASGSVPSVLPAPAGPTLQQRIEGSTLDETSPIGPEEAARVLAAAATPFDARRAPGDLARSVRANPVVGAASRRLDPRAPSGGDGSPLAGTALLAKSNPLEGTALIDEANPLVGTNPIRPEEVAKLFASAVTPFDARRTAAGPARSAAAATSPPAATPRSAPTAPAQHGGDGNPLVETSPISAEEAARVLASAATPFDARRAPAEPARSAAPAMGLPAAAARGGATPAAAARGGATAPAQHGGGNALEGTSSIDPEEAARLRATAATPFEARRAPVSARVELSSGARPSSAPSYPPPPAHETHLAPSPLVTSPSVAASPIVPPPGLGAASALPERLGAQFLAAMADIDLPAE
ncbi:DUF2169 domain-containing protein [Sorangium sp. So ce1182]|uniref:DUF2169 domain-containing protein n=1 Tax=Sorangium sp. So ce1182 TaxID=3133334 RepID=UPI003F5D63F5